MAFPATDLPDPSTWFSNALITSALMKSNIIDAINLLPRGFLGEAESTSAVTLSTTSAFAGLATYTFTLGSTRRVKIAVQARFKGTSGGRYQIRAGYNSGSSASIGSVTALSEPFDAASDVNSTWSSGFSVGTALLTAGTYTAYASLMRFSGNAADTADNHVVIVEDIGAS